MRSRSAEDFTRQLYDGLPFRGGIPEGGEHSRFSQFSLAHALHRVKAHGMAVPHRDRTGLVKKQGIDVTGQFHSLTALRQHVGGEGAVHAGQPDGGQQRADGGRDKAHEERDQRRDGQLDIKVEPHRIQRPGHKQEGEGQPGEGNGQRAFVGGLLAHGAFDQRDHAVKEGIAGRGSDADGDRVGQYAGAAGNAGTVAAGLADHGRGFAGDGGFIHAGRAFHHFAVGGDKFPSADNHEVALLEHVGHDLNGLSVHKLLGDGLGTGTLQGVGLRLAAGLRQRLGKIGEQHRSPQDDGHRQRIGHGRAAAQRIHHKGQGRQQRADFRHEHDGVTHHNLRVKHGEGPEKGDPDQFALKQGGAAARLAIP